METKWIDFLKTAAVKSPKPAPIVKGTLHRVARGPYGVPTKNQSQATVANGPMRRVGGSSGAVSTSWDPKYKPKYPDVNNPKLTDREKADLMKEIALAKERERQLAAVRKMYPNGNTPIHVARKAYNVRAYRRPMKTMEPQVTALPTVDLSGMR